MMKRQNHSRGKASTVGGLEAAGELKPKRPQESRQKALPGTAVHAYLDHISWPVAGLVALGSIRFLYLGARVALRTRSAKLERWYGLALTALGVFFLFQV
jgi:hypothetical protein